MGSGTGKACYPRLLLMCPTFCLQTNDYVSFDPFCIG